MLGKSIKLFCFKFRGYSGLERRNAVYFISRPLIDLLSSSVLASRTITGATMDSHGRKV